MEIDYGGWLIEDLKELYSELIKERDRLEDYSDRVQVNQNALRVMAEIQKRNNDEWFEIYYGGWLYVWYRKEKYGWWDLVNESE